MKLLLSVYLAFVAFVLFTGCQTEGEQAKHSQDRKQDMLLKQMQKEQAEAKRAQQMR